MKECKYKNSRIILIPITVLFPAAFSNPERLEFDLTNMPCALTVLLITSIEAIVISITHPCLVDAFPAWVAHEFTFTTWLQVVGSASAVMFIWSILTVHITIAQPPGRDTVHVPTLPLRTSADRRPCWKKRHYSIV